jgi:hypothetical protein
LLSGDHDVPDSKWQPGRNLDMPQTAGLQKPSHLAKGPLMVLDMLEHVKRDDCIECAGGQGIVGDIDLQQRRARQLLMKPHSIQVWTHGIYRDASPACQTQLPPHAAAASSVNAEGGFVMRFGLKVPSFKTPAQPYEIEAANVSGRPVP